MASSVAMGARPTSFLSQLSSSSIAPLLQSPSCASTSTGNRSLVCCAVATPGGDVSKSLSSSASLLAATKFPGAGGFSTTEGKLRQNVSQMYRPSFERPYRLDVRAARELTGCILRGEGLRFAVVAARFNEIITRPLVTGALETFQKYAVKDDDVDLVWVPGSFEIPLVAQQMAKSGKYEAVLAIGAVIRGATTHYDAVAGSAASGLMSAGLNSGVPVIFGILTTENMDQAIDRAGGKVGNKGAEAALTAIEMASLFKHQITPLNDTH